MKVKGAVFHLAVLLLFGGIAVATTYPLVWNLTDHIAGTPGDNYLHLWGIWWYRTAVETPGLSPLFCPLLLAPAGVSLALNDAVAFNAVVAWLTPDRLGIAGGYNTALLVALVLSAYGAFLLALKVTSSRPAAVVAGVIYGFSPYLFSHALGHLGYVTAQALPFFAICLLRLRESERWRWSALAGLCMVWAAYCHVYYAVYALLFLALAATMDGLSVSVGVRRRTVTGAWRRAAAGVDAALVLVGILLVSTVITGGFTIAAAGLEISVHGTANAALALWSLVALRLAIAFVPSIRVRSVAGRGAGFWGRRALPAAILVIGYLPVIAETVRLLRAGNYPALQMGFKTGADGIDLLALVTPQPFHPLFGGVVRPWYEGHAGGIPENVAFLGWTPLVLLTWARPWRRSREAARWTKVLLVFLALALGPFLIVAGIKTWFPFLPFQVLRVVPLVRQARIPGRATVMVMLAFSVLVAFAVARLCRAVGPRRTRLLVPLLLIAILFEFCAAPFPLSPTAIPGPYRELARTPGDGTLLTIPFGIGDGTRTYGHTNSRPQLYQIAHRRPLVGGYLARIPPLHWQRIRREPLLATLVSLQQGEIDADEAVRRTPPHRVRSFLERFDVAFVAIRLSATNAATRKFVETIFPVASILDGDGHRLLLLRRESGREDGSGR